VWDIEKWVDYADQWQLLSRVSGDLCRFRENDASICAMGHDFPLVGHDKLAEVLGQHLGIQASPARVFLPLELVCPKVACGKLGAQSLLSSLQVGGVPR
jgi:hypothetical protein